MSECKAKTDTPVIRVLISYRLFLAIAQKSDKSVSLLTRVGSYCSAGASYLPIANYSGSLSAHILRMLRRSLTLTASDTRGFAPHSVYARS